MMMNCGNLMWMVMTCEEGHEGDNDSDDSDTDIADAVELLVASDHETDWSTRILLTYSVLSSSNESVL